MDSRGIFIISSHFSKKTKIISLLISLTISALLLSLLLTNSNFFSPHSTDLSLSSINNSSTTTLQFSINQTLTLAKTARTSIADHFADQDLSAREKNAAGDCMELLDQTLYELQSAMAELAGSSHHLTASYGDTNTLLSAAMTNHYTCTNGFLDLEQLDSAIRRKGNARLLQNLLAPLSRMISSSLALIKNSQETVKKSNMTMMKMIAKRDYYGRRGREKKKGVRNLRPNAIVAGDGSGDYKLIGDAVAAAPNMSKKTYTIKINAGFYKENLMIPREKINIMLIGDGMNSTIITASRNLADGFSTFQSATLTVVGDKFMAKDLTIENTAAPEKHQAVALRVTSNAAFYRCRIVSYQDTLYAHSLRQLYQECTIEGTIDFIFGNAAAVFRNCRILARRPLRGQRNTITAQGREDPNQNTGISLQSCSVEAAADFSPTERKHFSTYLGRPWRRYARVIVVSSYLGELVHPRGWLEWPEYSSVETVEYAECRNYGPGAAAMKRRVSWAGYRKSCSEEMVRQFAVEEFLHGADDWLESTVMPMFSGSR